MKFAGFTAMTFRDAAQQTPAALQQTELICYSASVQLNPGEGYASEDGIFYHPLDVYCSNSIHPFDL